MADSWKDMTAADIEARNARIKSRGPMITKDVAEWLEDHSPAPKLPPKPSKYRNVRTKIGDEVFDSQREARYWLVLKAREAEGEITQLRRQVEFPLYCAAGDVGKQVSAYIADFFFLDQNLAAHVLDAKGKKTQMFVLKAKWLFLQQGIFIECV